MGKREKAIDGLDCCLEGICEACDYKGSDAPGGCKDELMYDALELLKAQEAQVMTLEEAQKTEYVYLETRKWVDGDYLGLANRENNDFPDYTTDFLDGYGCVMSCDNSMYGDNWRCWTSMPTDAQREATPWG